MTMRRQSQYHKLFAILTTHQRESKVRELPACNTDVTIAYNARRVCTAACDG